jgi:hypothetical protein
MTCLKSLTAPLILLALLTISISCTGPAGTPATEQPSSSVTPSPTASAIDYSNLLPPRLAKDFYPNGLTRDTLIAGKPQAVVKTGVLDNDETWEGIISVTGDFRVPQGVTLNISPGTLVLVSALSDDQKSGGTSGQDHYNPKKPVCDEAYTQSRVEIMIDGSLIARGTAAEPIIITSDAATPQTDDWMGMQFSQGAAGDLERTVIEYGRIFGISSSNVTIKQSILRNMLETIVIMGQGEELLTLSPVIMQSYIYNIGQMAITVRSGKPTITHNIIRPRQDADTLFLPGFEYGAIGVDHPADPLIAYNFLEGGASVPYGEYDISGNYYDSIVSTALGFHASIAPATIAYNTFYEASLAGLEVFPSPVTIEHNNFIGNYTNLQVQESLYEPSDAWQQELFEQGIISPLRAQKITVTNNYWGVLSREEIASSIHDNSLVQIEFEPYEVDFIPEALPAWHEFLW